MLKIETFLFCAKSVCIRTYQEGGAKLFKACWKKERYVRCTKYSSLDIKATNPTQDIGIKYKEGIQKLKKWGMKYTFKISKVYTIRLQRYMD